MKGKTAFNAMEGIDPRYILEAAPDAAVRKGSKAPYIRILAVAAAVAVLTAVAVLGAGIMKQSGENPPAVPPVGETQDAQTSAEGEGDESTEPPANEKIEVPPMLNGSYSTDLYTVEEIDGKHYINFFDGNEKPNGGNSGGNAAVLRGIYFDSIEEMKQKFLTGNFSTDEVTNLKSQLTLTDKGFEIPDMTNLYDAVLPEEWSVLNVILNDDRLVFSIQNGSTYDTMTGDDTGEYGYVAFMKEQRYNQDYQLYFASQIEKAQDGLLADQTIFYGIPCVMYESSNSVTKVRSVVMEYEQNGCSFEILVSYILEHDQKPELIDPNVPYSVIMYGNMNGHLFKISLYGFENAPDADFYKAFGFQKHGIIK